MDEIRLEMEAAARLPDGFHLKETTEGCLKQNRTYVHDKAGCAVTVLSFGKSL